MVLYVLLPIAMLSVGKDFLDKAVFYAWLQFHNVRKEYCKLYVPTPN